MRPFFVANSDVYTDLELKDLLAAHSGERIGRGHRGGHPADGEHRLRGRRPRRPSSDRASGRSPARSSP